MDIFVIKSIEILFEGNKKIKRILEDLNLLIWLQSTFFLM